MSLREWVGLLATELRCTANELATAYAWRAGIPSPLNAANAKARVEDRAHPEVAPSDDPLASTPQDVSSSPLGAAIPPNAAAAEGEGPRLGGEIRGTAASNPRPGVVRRPSAPHHSWELHGIAATFGKAVPGCVACEKAVQR